MDNQKFITVGTSVVLSTLVMLGFGYKMNQTYLSTVGTVNLRALLVEQQEQVSSKYKVASEDGLKEAAKLAVKLDEAVASIANECNCVLVNSEAVIGGKTIDYTEEVRAKISEGSK